MSKPRAVAERQPNLPHAQSRWFILYPAGVGVAALGLFFFTLAPTVTAEDSGELIAAAWHFGIPHPPGYPLWTLLCGIFMHILPFGEIAYRANLFSAICSAGAAVVAYAAMRELRLSRSVAAAAALVWVWCEWSWAQSVIAEVYGLNSLLTAGMLWCALRWHRTDNSKFLVAAAVMLGLGMSNHQIIALAGLALVVWILMLRPGLVRRWRLVLICLAAFAVGLLPYAYLPIRASAEPPINWGDPSTPQRMWEHVARHHYQGIGPTHSVEPRSLGRLGSQLLYIGEAVWDDLTPWMTCAGVFGLLLLARRNRRILLLVALWLACTCVLFAVLANFDSDRSSRWLMRVFLISAPLALVIPMAFALDWLREVLYARLTGHRRLAVAIAGALVVAGPAAQVVSHWDRCDYSNYWYARDHAENLLSCMQPDAMVFAFADYNVFPLVYLTMVEGRRPDVLIANITGHVEPKLYKDRPPDDPNSPVAWLIKNEDRPIYCTDERPSPVASTRFAADGTLYRLVPENEIHDGSRNLGKCPFRNLRGSTVQDLGADLIMIHYHTCMGSAGLKRGDREAAPRHIRTAAGLGHGMKGILNRAGVLMFTHDLEDEGIGYCEASARIDPRYTEPRWNLFQMYRKQSRWTEVRRQLMSIIEADPDDARACAELGFLLQRYFNDLQGAVRYWREALRRNPNLPQIKRILDQYDQRE